MNVMKVNKNRSHKRGEEWIDGRRASPTTSKINKLRQKAPTAAAAAAEQQQHVLELLRHSPPRERGSLKIASLTKPTSYRRKRPRSAFAIAPAAAIPSPSRQGRTTKAASRERQNNRGVGRSPLPRQVKSAHRPTAALPPPVAGDYNGAEQKVIFIDDDPGADPTERKIKQLIVTREDFLSKLKDVVRAPGFIVAKYRKDFQDLLVLLRRISLEVVEAIEFWRKQPVRQIL